MINLYDTFLFNNKKMQIITPEVIMTSHRIKKRISSYLNITVKKHGRISIQAYVRR